MSREVEFTMKKISVPQNFLLYTICLLSAAGLLALCSKSSPLYPLNDWGDINCFYTVGKGMLHGRVPYVDLLDHKGPYVYALGAAAYLMDRRGFGGYFLFELLSMYCFLFYSYKLSALYMGEDAGRDNKVCLWMLPLLGMTVVSAKSFVHGGSWEQLSLGVFAYAVYSLLAFMRSREPALSARVLVINGLLAGVLFWSKFSLLGLYIAWVLTVILLYLRRKQWAALGKAALLFGCGAAATTLPWLAYFGVHGAVKTWLKVYLYENVFVYGMNTADSSGTVSLLTRGISTMLNIWDSLADRENWLYSVPLALGIGFFLLQPPRKVSPGEKLAVLLMGAGLASGIFIGSAKHDYYGLPLAVFSIWGMWLGSTAVNGLKNLLRRKTTCSKPIWSDIVPWAISMLCALCISYHVSPNTYLLLTDKADMPQFRFAEQILNSEDTTLLNYLFLDGGFYTVTGQVPTERIFCMFNMNRAERIKQQQEYVRQQRTHWIVTWRALEVSEEELRGEDVLTEYYDLVDYMYFYFEGDYRTYALYEKK